MLSPLQNLPQEIQNLILSYTYSPQSKYLLEDIQNFYETKEYLYEIIEEVESQNTYYFISAIDEVHNEICNFIYYYLYDCSNEFINIYFWQRYFMYKNISDKSISRNIIDKLCGYPINSQINILWGIMLPEERNSFLNYYTSDYEEDTIGSVEEEDYDY